MNSVKIRNSEVFLVYGYHQSVQKQNCLIMFFIMVMEAKACFGRTRMDSVKMLTRTIRANALRSVQ